MLDIKFIRENKELVEKNSLTRNVKIDLSAIIRLDEEKNLLLKQAEALRAKRNDKSKTKPTDAEIIEMKKVGQEIAALDDLLKKKSDELQSLLTKIPNINDPSVPVGKDDSENKVSSHSGKKPEFDFTPKEHFAVESVLSGIDMERGAKVSGSRFYYLKGKVAQLERAIMQYAVDFMVGKGFELVLPPVLVREEAMYGTGFFPADKNEVYAVNPTEDNLYLVGTSEVSLIYMHADETFNESDLPKKYIAIT
ncbi:MAG: serine--tRNA ligase, partial [Candidatus Magasanikbacteria bacterium]